MREHVAVNSRCAKVGSLQNLQTWQIIFFLSFYTLLRQWFKRRCRKFKFLFLLRRNVVLYLLPSTHREWESFFCRFLQMLLTAVNGGHDRGECCLSAVFFALLTCWHVQYLKIFAFFFFSTK